MLFYRVLCEIRKREFPHHRKTFHSNTYNMVPRVMACHGNTQKSEYEYTIRINNGLLLDIDNSNRKIAESMGGRAIFDRQSKSVLPSFTG